MSVRSLGAPCPPKLNLFLEIHLRRPDGYHELSTVFQALTGGDVLTVFESDRLTMECTDPVIPTDDRNLVIQAGRLLREVFPQAAARGAHLRLEKRIPVGAGLGGGSANAAVALRLLARLWDLAPTEEQLAALAVRLGSDVPFFLLGGTALAMGRGEVLVPLRTPRLHFVLLRPPVAVITGWAYRRWDPARNEGGGVREFVAALETGEPERIAPLLRNDIEPGVVSAVPEVRDALAWLRNQGLLGARMTGSGSVVFGIARDAEHAAEVAARPGAPGELWTAQSAVGRLGADDE